MIEMKFPSEKFFVDLSFFLLPPSCRCKLQMYWYCALYTNKHKKYIISILFITCYIHLSVLGPTKEETLVWWLIILFY